MTAVPVEHRRRQAADELRRHLADLAADHHDEFTRSLEARLVLGRIQHLAVLCDITGRILHANDSLLETTGSSMERLHGTALAEAPWWREGSGSAATTRFLLEQAISGPPSRALVEICHPGERLASTYELSVTAVVDSDDEIAFLLAEAHDAGERLAAEAIIEEQRRSLVDALEREERLIAESSDLLAVHDLNGRFLRVNPAARTIAGVEPAELVGTTPLDRAHPDDRTVVSRAFHPASPAYQGPLTIDYRWRHADGSYRNLRTTLRPRPDPAGRVRQLESTTADVTEPADEADIVHRALADDLTGLPNRTLLLDRLQQALSGARRNGRPLAVLLLDIDDFHHVARTLGPQSADATLQAVGQRLSGLVRPGDTVARLGSDEFVMLCADTDAESGAVVVTRRVLAALDEPLVVHGRPVFIGASVGIAVSHGDHDPLPLLQEAEAALVRAKDAGRGQYTVFDPDEDGSFAGVDSMETALRRGLERHEFVLHYQPERDLLSGALTGFEALIRWQRDDELVSPAEFIGPAERSGLIIPIGRWVIHEACRQIRLWRSLTAAAVPPVWINLSARQLGEPDLVADISSALAEFDLEPSSLGVELTESAMLGDADAAAEQLRHLHAMGVRIGLDDFGTGYSSLTHLVAFPLDVVKIDRSFVAGLGHDDQSHTIVSAVIDMAHRLGLTTIAEGVETRLQLDQLIALGCQDAVGYYFDPPLPATRCLSVIDGQSA